VMRVCDEPVIDREARMWSGHHVVAGRYVLESSGGPMGEAVEWFARLMFAQAHDPVQQVFDAAGDSEVGSAGMLSTLGAEVMDARNPRMPFGQFTLSHLASPRDPAPRRHLCRALLEGLACAVRANVEQLEGVAGRGSDELVLLGGLSRSARFARMVADVSGRAVTVFDPWERTAWGAAICAAAGVHGEADLAAVAARYAGTSTSFEPEPDRADAHAALYEAWSGLREAGRDSTEPFAASHSTAWALRAADH